MSTAQDLTIDQFAPMVESGTRLTTWYAQGHSDGLGDRLLMFDNTSAPSWEILRFKPALARDPRFETALRQRVERLTTFHHPAFPVVRSIKELGHESGLAVVSTYISGVRLSDALKKPRSAEFALQLVRQLMPALSALHDHEPAIAHGALTLDRVVLTAEGRLMIREHVIGSALAGLDLSAASLWSDFGVLVPPTKDAIPRLDGRSDVAQLALVALSLVVGRRIGPDEYPQAVPELLQRMVRLESLRRWLERALQIDDRAFATVREATDALADSAHSPPREDDGLEVSLRAAPRVVPRPEATAQNAPRTGERQHPLAPTGIVPMSSVSRRPRAFRWAAIVASVVALVEAGLIGRILLLGPGGVPQSTAATPSVVESSPPIATGAADQPLVVPPLAVQVEQEIPGIRVLPAVGAVESSLTPSVTPATTAPTTESALPPPVAVRSGGFRVSSPIELHVLDGERVLGSSEEGPIMAPAGRHEFEFVNSVVGYRVRREVDVKAGQITALSVAVPNGSLNINATPWAAVWIDGTPYGETPLGNLSLVPGEHEIVFRHPQLGERKETVIVRPDAAGRVAVSLQQ